MDRTLVHRSVGAIKMPVRYLRIFRRFALLMPIRVIGRGQLAQRAGDIVMIGGQNADGIRTPCETRRKPEQHAGATCEEARVAY